MTILPLDDGYRAVCPDCAWSFDCGSEEFAEEMGRQHESFYRHQDAKDALARYAALPPVAQRVDDGHVHNPGCTFEVCGVGPTRAELIARRVHKYEKHSA